MLASYSPYNLTFKKRILTSRGGMNHKHGFYVFISQNELEGIGECSFIKGLSRDNLDSMETTLHFVCNNIDRWIDIKESIFETHPAICFAVETAILDLKHGGKRMIFPSDFTTKGSPIPINGLVWMGDEMTMSKEIDEKYNQGFRCIKLKVGAIDFEAECRLLEKIRTNYNEAKIEIRLDANGAFTASNVRDKLKVLSQFKIHSIEQPITTGQWSLMKELCEEEIIDIALDEELIPIIEKDEKEKMLSFIKPQYIILKPSLLGGLEKADEWIEQAAKNNIKWWSTSALESNVGLNAIAQWVFTKGTRNTQGLGTGALYENNISSPLAIENAQLVYKSDLIWDDVSH